jgi:hypothetical protein
VTAEEVIGEVVKILSAAGVGWPALIVAVVVVAVALLLLKKVPRLPGAPDSMKPPPDAAWGDNVKPDGGPPGGDMGGG